MVWVANSITFLFTIYIIVYYNIIFPAMKHYFNINFTSI